MLQLSENTAFVSICRMYIHTVSTISKEQQIYTWSLGGHNLYTNCAKLGTGWNVVAPCLYFTWHRHFAWTLASTCHLWFSSHRS
jgi:hypothetical protein